MNQHFEDDNHALKTGMVLGVLMKHGIDSEPETDGPDYTDVVIIHHEDRGFEYTFRVKVLP